MLTYNTQKRPSQPHPAWDCPRAMPTSIAGLPRLWQHKATNPDTSKHPFLGQKHAPRRMTVLRKMTEVAAVSSPTNSGLESQPDHCLFLLWASPHWLVLTSQKKPALWVLCLCCLHLFMVVHSHLTLCTCSSSWCRSVQVSVIGKPNHFMYVFLCLLFSADVDFQRFNFVISVVSLCSFILWHSFVLYAGIRIHLFVLSQTWFVSGFGVL